MFCIVAWVCSACCILASQHTDRLQRSQVTWPSHLVLLMAQMVKSVLSDEQNNRLESVELERTLNHMMDAVYCPRCSTISLEDEDNCAQCSNCFFAFCSLCNESWHPGTKCLSPEDKLELMRRRMAGTKSGDREFRKREAELQNLAHIEVR